MLVIADSGSTKTDWCIIHDNGEFFQTQTIGLNPYFIEEESFREVLLKDIYPFLDNTKVEQVYFYGSGCLAEEKKQFVKDCLADFFSQADVVVESDLLGAGIALFGKEAGLVSILGTGCSTCVYDGNSIIDHRISLGYLLGDEGSGAYIGMKVLADFLTKKMPAPLYQVFAKEYPYQTHEILDQVYKEQFPNRFFGGFARFAFQYKEHDYIRELLKASFSEFFDKQISAYNTVGQYPIGILGSTAYYFKEIMEEVAAEKGISIYCVLAAPMENLRKYHKELYLKEKE